MKKFFAFVSALTLALSLAAVPAFAETINTAAGSSSHAVTATYDDGSGSSGGGSGTIVYSVNIEWGAMEFTYTAASTGKWNPDTHQYDTNDASWSSGNTNTVTITNHSNAAVTATLSYSPEAGFEGISGTFDKATINLATAEGTSVENAPTETARLTLTSELASTTADNTTIGTVTVTLG